MVAFCRSKIGTPYVYGMKGKVMTEQNYKFLKNTYGKMVWLSDRDKIGKVCVDCSGLISWACGVTLGSGQWKARATKINPISTIEKAPIGALVWMQGHIGVYTGMKNGHPYYVAADVRLSACEKSRCGAINSHTGCWSRMFSNTKWGMMKWSRSAK